MWKALSNWSPGWARRLSPGYMATIGVALFLVGLLLFWIGISPWFALMGLFGGALGGFDSMDPDAVDSSTSNMANALGAGHLVMDVLGLVGMAVGYFMVKRALSPPPMSAKEASAMGSPRNMPKGQSSYRDPSDKYCSKCGAPLMANRTCPRGHS